MKSTSIHCSVITPERQVLDASATAVVLPAHDGQIGVLIGRAPLLCELGTGVLKVDVIGQGAREYFVDGGFAQVLNNEVIVLTERAAAADDISRTQAAKDLTEAQQLPMHGTQEVETRQRAIQRAQTQLHIAKK